MGSIGQKYSDLCIITSDNPRTEEPELIIKDILEGIDKKKKITMLLLIENKL